MEKHDDAFPRDRDGVPFENDFTDDNLPSPAQRAGEEDDTPPDPDIDSDAGDRFMEDRLFPDDLSPAT